MTTGDARLPLGPPPVIRRFQSDRFQGYLAGRRALEQRCALGSRYTILALAALLVASPAARAAEPVAAVVAPAVDPAKCDVVLADPAAVLAAPPPPTPAEAAEDAADDRADEAADAAGVDAEAESHDLPQGPPPGGPRYTAELTDAELERRWKEDPASLGSMSIGFTDSGRLVNSVAFPEGEQWVVVDPPNSYATQETIDAVSHAIRTVNAEIACTPPLRVNHLSKQNGGWLRPHRSHQSGRDVDLAFYYLDAATHFGVRNREKLIDLPRNWSLLRAFITDSDVQMVLVDRRIVRVLYLYALSIGEDPAWLATIFRAGRDSLVQHARHHRDHFHARFYNPRAQELGRRIQPFLGRGKDPNIVMHRIQRGHTLGHIAMKYGSSVVAIRKLNGLRSNLLSVGRTLAVPMRGPCTHCPLPPELVLPSRKLPPQRPVAVATAPEPAPTPAEPATPPTALPPPDVAAEVASP